MKFCSLYRIGYTGGGLYIIYNIISVYQNYGLQRLRCSIWLIFTWYDIWLPKIRFVSHYVPKKAKLWSFLSEFLLSDCKLEGLELYCSLRRAMSHRSTENVWSFYPVNLAKMHRKWIFLIGRASSSDFRWFAGEKQKWRNIIRPCQKYENESS